MGVAVLTSLRFWGLRQDFGKQASAGSGEKQIPRFARGDKSEAQLRDDRFVLLAAGSKAVASHRTPNGRDVTSELAFNTQRRH
jgi:hypothetical protein